jgi:predicted PurR-regulated permease PerM
VLWVTVAVLAAMWVLRDLVLLIGYSVLLAYALLPAVAAIERPFGRRGPQLPRSVAAGVMMLILATAAGWLLALAVPRLGAEAARFVSGAPGDLTRLLEGMRAYGAAHGLSSWLNPVLEEVRVSVANLLQNLAGSLGGWIGRHFGGIGQALGLALLPLLAFYLLAESAAVQKSALRFFPKDARSEIARLGGAVDRALRSYVRGQAIVCLVMGIAMGAALAIMGSPVALLLGLLVGFAEVIPYLGFMVAAIAIGLAGLGVSPLHAVEGIAAYVVINWAIGTFVTPRVMGRYLKLHPFIVTVSVLAGTEILGPAGALLALPGAAVLQAVVGELATTPVSTRVEAALHTPADRP